MEGSFLERIAQGESDAVQACLDRYGWSNARQSGYMRFTGLAANDPSESQYQLWIFDGERDDRYPIDGGVFDVPASGEVVVPIAAKLRAVGRDCFVRFLQGRGKYPGQVTKGQSSNGP